MTADDLMRLVNRYTEACDDLGAGLFNQTEAETNAKHAKAKELHGQLLAEVYRLHAVAETFELTGRRTQAGHSPDAVAAPVERLVRPLVPKREEL